MGLFRKYNLPEYLKNKPYNKNLEFQTKIFLPASSVLSSATANSPSNKIQNHNARYSCNLIEKKTIISYGRLHQLELGGGNKE